jgi:hypothetical protein
MRLMQEQADKNGASGAVFNSTFQSAIGHLSDLPPQYNAKMPFTSRVAQTSSVCRSVVVCADARSCRSPQNALLPPGDDEDEK